RRLAGADFSGERDEAFALVQPVLQVSVGAFVSAAGVEERGIGAQLERLFGQVVERFEHGRSESMGEADKSRTRVAIGRSGRARVETRVGKAGEGRGFG